MNVSPSIDKDYGLAILAAMERGDTVSIDVHGVGLIIDKAWLAKIIEEKLANDIVRMPLDTYNELMSELRQWRAYGERMRKLANDLLTD